MGESRDARDPRDLLRAMRKEAEAEFEAEEAHDAGGQAHASARARAGAPAGRADEPDPGADGPSSPGRSTRR
ncbi:MAG: hypothetical protein QM767_25640 [Anaeromyxobacter sp.]